MTTTAEKIRTYQGPALFSFGFRPFFLSAAIWAALAVPVWLATYLVGPGTTPFETGLVWYVHEMVFGYGAAVVAGFLLTAIPNWTGRLPVSGMPLVLLWLLWCAGRLAFTLEPVPDPLGALIESAFLICFAALVWREVIAGRNTRNLKVAGAVSVFAGLNWADKRRAKHILFMPCGMPFVPDALLERFEAARKNACQPVVAASGGHWHPVCALWPVARLPDVLDCARSGCTRLTTVLPDCGAVDVSWDTHPFDPFFNINSLEDLNAAEDIAISEGLVQEVGGR